MVPPSPPPRTPSGLPGASVSRQLGVERRQHVARAAWRSPSSSRPASCPLSRIVVRMLPQRLADALGDAAVGLAVQDQRIDGAADVVDRGVARRSRSGRCRGRSRPRRPRSRTERPRMRINSSQSAASGPRRSSGRSLRSRAARATSNRPIERSVPFTVKRPSAKATSAGIGLQHVAGDFRRLLDHRLRRLAHDDAAHAHRARRMRAAADRHDVGVALDQLDAVDIDAEPFADALREARLVALAAGQRADRDIDAALRLHVDLGRIRAARRW